jgi:pyridoxamine 5'-phosphate oxidase family protein
VGFAYNSRARAIDIGGHAMASSQKFRNVLANGRAAFVVDDIASWDPWQVRCLEIRGIAEALAEPTDSASRGSGPIIRIHPRRVISWGIDEPGRGRGKRDVHT